MKTLLLSLACCLGLAAQDPLAEHFFPPELILGNARAAGLDDSQIAFLRAEAVKAQARFSELQFQMQDALEALVQLIRTPAVDEARALAALDRVLQIEKEIKRAQLGLVIRMKNRLTPEQQQRLQALKKKP